MSLAKAAISLIGASSVLLAAPAFATNGAASRLSLAGSSAVSPASPSVAKGRSFTGENGILFALLGVVAFGTFIAIVLDDDNGAPVSP